MVLDDSCPEQAGKQRQLNQDEEEDSSLKPGNYWQQQQQQQPSGSPSRHRCFFPGCSNQADDACAHISLCLSLSPEQQSSMFAQALLVKHSVLNQMSISPDLKHEIWLGARRNGPLVQRVSTTTMVVKCGESEHPLGYLHVVFDHKNRTEPRMWCSCADRGDQQGCCFHFYACIAVFASDEKLSEEFGFFIALQHELADDNSMKQVITILGHDENGDTIQVEVLDKEQIELLTQNNYVTAANEEEDPQEIVQVNALNFAASAMASSSGSEGPAAPVINFNAEDLPISLIVSEDGTLQAAAKEQPQQELIELRPPVREESPLKPRSRRQPSSKSALLKRPHAVPEIIADLDVPGMTDETLASISFTDWLSGVTEAINESMHYDANGDDPEPLIFLAPAGFFNCLRDRMSVGGRGGGGGVFEEGPVKKSRLPNDSRTGYRSATPGVGMFTTYVWKIRNILLLKKVFDTPKVPLEITR